MRCGPRAGRLEQVHGHHPLQSDNKTKASDKFLVAANRPENDEHWASDEKKWVGTASMAPAPPLPAAQEARWGSCGASSTCSCTGWATRQGDHAAEGGDPPAEGHEARREGVHEERPDVSVVVEHRALLPRVPALLGQRDAPPHRRPRLSGPTDEHLEFKNLNLDDCIKVLEEEESSTWRTGDDHARRRPTADRPRNSVIRQRTGRGASGASAELNASSAR